MRVPKQPSTGEARASLLKGITTLLEPLTDFAYSPDGAAASEVEAEAADAAVENLRTLEKALRRPVAASEPVPDPQGV